MKFLRNNNNLIFNIPLISFIFTIIFEKALSRKIILIQNAEPDQHDSNILSLTGEARSICLNELIQNDESLRPQIIYAQNPNGDVYTPLPLKTVNYLASQLNIKIIDTFKERQQAKLASTIENLPDDIETVLLCWNRYQIELLVKTLGIDNPPTWNDGYDNLWIVENDNLKDTTQNLGSCIERVKADLISGTSTLSLKTFHIMIFVFFLFLFLN
ncbi:hypothetical protein BCR32DRAFT_266478 [Anaeromyces robustus]|uniref:Uncharacterized protein n=1 Tax=Anaeromyces robustus TaxID=1754192 RepID=A0A1Y1XEH2_9FUNG|nr:hypothetical protein BCR32DRAFT_266478 [Anaeromyces robustus]|eukprot:ORX84160.1 hypothetical protein BCR32DRAFT_266478 [Anaeromyces robustus]